MHQALNGVSGPDADDDAGELNNHLHLNGESGCVSQAHPFDTTMK